jgi:hypothetical protein
MNRKILLSALAAVSAAVLVVPATASAYIPLHLEPMAANTLVPVTTPAGAPAPFLSALNTNGGATSTVICNSVTGNATFDAGGTTGTLNLTFGGSCNTGGVSCRSTAPNEPAGNIQTTTLPFELVTLPGKLPGVLVTPNADGSFAHILCAIVAFTVTGNGVIGTIENVKCDETKATADVSFEQASHGIQKHTKVEGTETIYSLKKGAEHAAQVATARLTFANPIPKLVCT